MSTSTNNRSLSDDSLIELLVMKSLAPATQRQYSRVLTHFKDFHLLKHGKPPQFPVSQSTVSQYVIYLFRSDLAAASIQSYMSAISFIHKINEWPDPTQSFFLKKLLKGIHNMKGRVDCRLPITKDILHQIVLSTDQVLHSYMKALLCRAMFLLAFHAFLRIGEITTTALHDTQHILQVSDTEFSPNFDTLNITIRHFKHSNQQPVTISISQAANPTVCPVRTIRNYLETYGHKNGPLFQFADGNPVSYAFFVKSLDSILAYLGLNKRLYRGHSFRIGAATTAAASGLSEVLIQKLGRWKSDAVKRYIRIPKL